MNTRKTNWIKSFWFGPKKKEEPGKNGGGFLADAMSMFSRKKRPIINDDEDMILISSCFMRIIGEQNESC
jgi:hypothetical protein